MTTDFELHIRPGGTANHLVISLTASDPALNLNEEEFLRTSFAIDANNIKDLRSGNPAFALVNRIANEMSTWLLGEDMRGYLNAHILGNDPVRLIFRIHPKLLDQMADLPIELLRYKDQWVIFRKAVSAIVHELPNTSLPQQPSQSLPLKVLVVRSSPSGLKVNVPPAGPICNDIIKLDNELGPNVVQVDLLSREVTSLEPGQTWDQFEAAHLPNLTVQAGDPTEIIEKKESLKWREFREYLLNRKISALEPGTWDKFTSHLRNYSTNYHIIVYLGHGNHIKLFGSESKVGVLQFESANGKGIDSVSSRDLQQELQNRKIPVPVVLLIGCVTAAEVDALDAEERKNIPEWTRGSQGVAQRLVDSASGVECAVGMRYQIETNAAVKFLKAFFESLLKGTPGNVEAAVRAARWKLSKPEHPPSWSAPVIFRTRGAEPMFKFIADIPTTYKLDRADIRDQEAREALWTALTEDPDYQFAYEKLTETENQIKQKVINGHGALIMPEMKKATPGENFQTTIKLFGQLLAETLKCKLSVSGPAASIGSLHSTQALKDRGFMLVDMTEGGSSEIGFTIKRNAGATVVPEGGIITAELSLGTLIPAKYMVNLNILEKKPEDVKVRPINNVVLVLQN